MFKYLFLTILFVTTAVNATCSSSAYMDLTSLSVCVWDSNMDGIPDSGGTSCASGNTSVWAKAYTGVSLQAQCLPTTLFPALGGNSGVAATTTATTTTLNVVACVVPWSSTSSGALVCPKDSQVSVNLFTFSFWGGIETYMTKVTVVPDIVFFWFGSLFSLWVLGFVISILTRLLRRY